MLGCCLVVVVGGSVGVVVEVVSVVVEGSKISVELNLLDSVESVESVRLVFNIL